MTFHQYCQSLGGQMHLYANASNGYRDLLAHLREQRTAGRKSADDARHSVVLPSYLPAKLVRASLAAGCTPRFYDVHGRCTPDLDQLHRAIDADTLAVLAIHYFGFPTDMNAVLALAHERGAFVVEDCALTLAASHQGLPLGTRGDASLFSFRKMFLYSEGGALRIDPTRTEALARFRPRYDRRVRSMFSLRHFALQKLKHGYVRVTAGRDPLRVFRVDPTGYVDLGATHHQTVKRPSAFTERRLERVDVDETVRLRRSHYQAIADAFPTTHRLEPLHHELPLHVTPYSFPFLVLDGRRDDVRRALLRAGVACGAGWPEGPFGADERGRSRRLAGALLELPVHQQLTGAQLARSIEALRDVVAPARTPVAARTWRLA